MATTPHKVFFRRGWSPVAFGSSLHLWLRSDKGLVFDGDGVAQWLDQSGRGNHATQSTPALQPRHEPAGGVNGTPALVWDASNRAMTIPLASASDDATVVVVFQQGVFKGVGDQHLLQQGDTQYQLEQNGAQIIGFADPTERSIGAAQLGPQILEYQLDSAGLTIEGFRNGVSIGSDTYDGTNGLNGTTGLGANSTSSGSFSRIKMSELIFADRLQSESERTSLYGYLARRYGL